MFHGQDQDKATNIYFTYRHEFFWIGRYIMNENKIDEINLKILYLMEFIL